MILEQKLHEEDGKTILTNRIDCTEAIETASKAQSAGDKAEFIRLVKKFFSMHPAFAVHRDHTRRVWQGGVTSD